MINEAVRRTGPLIWLRIISPFSRVSQVPQRTGNLTILEDKQDGGLRSNHVMTFKLNTVSQYFLMLYSSFGRVFYN